MRPYRPGQFHVIGIKFDVYASAYLSNCSCGWNGPVPRATHYCAQADAAEHLTTTRSCRRGLMSGWTALVAVVCGSCPERANLRSVTPEGFARAVFAANSGDPLPYAYGHEGQPDLFADVANSAEREAS